MPSKTLLRPPLALGLCGILLAGLAGSLTVDGLDLLPGLWLVALAFLLDRLLRRLYDPVPLQAWALFAVALLALFGGVLFGGETLLPVGDIQRFSPYGALGLESLEQNPLQRDLTHAIAPWQAEVRRAYGQGEWPLWNTSSGAGVPLLANPQATTLHPLVLAAFPVSLPAALGVVAALRVLVAFVFTFLLLRRQEISPAPAVAGALAYGLGGFMILWLGWPHTNSTATLPVLLYATVLWSEEGRRRDLALLVVALFSTLVTGHPETALHVLVFGGLFALARIAAAKRDRRRKIFAGWAVAAVLGGLLAAPVLLPASSYLSKTNRYADMVERKERLTSQGLLERHWKRSLRTADQRLMPALTPKAWGDNRHGSYWGHHNVNEAAGGFAGTLTALAALLALFPAARRRFPQERFMLVMLVACGAVILRPPLFMELTLRLPPFDKSPTFHGRIVMVLGFVLAYLAACTLERWRRHGLPRPRTVAVVAGLGALILWGYLAHPHPEDPASLAELRHASLGVQLVVLGLGAACLLAPRRLGRGRKEWIVVALVGVELLVFHGDVNTPAPRSHFYPPSPPLTYVQDRLAEDSEGHRMMGLHATLPPEFAAVYDLPDIRGLGPSQPLRVSRLVDPLRSRPGSFLLNVADHPILDLLGVRYVVAEPHVDLPAPLEPVFRDPNAVVWVRPGALPRLFLPRSALRLAQVASWQRWTAENPSFAQGALVLATPTSEAKWTASAPEASRLELRRVTDTHLRARAELAEDRLVASGIYQDDGWRLLVDGERRPTTLANGPLLAAWVPAGIHRLDFVYRPPGFLAGMVLASLAGAGLLFIAVPPPAARRPSPSREG